MKRSAFWLKHTALKKVSAGTITTRGLERRQESGVKQHFREQQQLMTLLEKRITEAEKKSPAGSANC